MPPKDQPTLGLRPLSNNPIVHVLADIKDQQAQNFYTLNLIRNGPDRGER